MLFPFSFPPEDGDIASPETGCVFLSLRGTESRPWTYRPCHRQNPL